MFETVTLDMKQISIKSKWSLDRVLTYNKQTRAVIPPRPKN